MITKKVSFNYNNQQINGYFYLPKREGSFPTVVYVHGFAGGLIYPNTSEVCKALAESGFAVFVFEFYNKPSGLSPLPIEDLTVTEEVLILQQALTFVRKQSFVKSLSLVAHSLGSLVATAIAVKDKQIEKLVLHAPVFQPKKRFSYFIRLWWRVRKRRPFSFSWGSFQLSYAFVKDFLSYDFYQLINKISCPLLIIHGQRDGTIPFQESQKLLLYAPKGTKLKLLPTATHNFRGDGALEQLIKETKKFLK